jgi:hypothetical protein
MGIAGRPRPRLPASGWHVHPGACQIRIPASPNCAGADARNRIFVKTCRSGSTPRSSVPPPAATPRPTRRSMRSHACWAGESTVRPAVHRPGRGSARPRVHPPGLQQPLRPHAGWPLQSPRLDSGHLGEIALELPADRAALAAATANRPGHVPGYVDCEPSTFELDSGGALDAGIDREALSLGPTLSFTIRPSRYGSVFGCMRPDSRPRRATSRLVQPSARVLPKPDALRRANLADQGVGSGDQVGMGPASVASPTGTPCSLQEQLLCQLTPRVLRFSRDAGAIAEAVVLLRRRPAPSASACAVVPEGISFSWIRSLLYQRTYSAALRSTFRGRGPRPATV